MFPCLNMVCGLEGLLESSLHVKSLQSCPNLYHRIHYSSPESLVPGIFPGWILDLVAISVLLQRIFLTQGSNPSSLLCLLHWQAGSFQVAPPAGILEGAKFRGWKISWGMGETVNCGPERSFNYKTVSSLKA